MTAATTTVDRPLRRAGWRPRPMTVLTIGHGLFAGAYLTAYLTAEIWPVGHGVAGLTALALLTLRLAMAALAPRGSWAALPRPKPEAWKALAKKIAAGRWDVFATRTPLVPLSSQLALIGVALAALSGALVLVWRWDDPHEALAKFSLLLIGIHLAVVALGAGLRARAASAD